MVSVKDLGVSPARPTSTVTTLATRLRASGRSERWPRLARTGLWVVCGLVGLHIVLALTRLDESALGGGLDRVAFAAALVGAAMLLAVRTLLAEEERAAWGVMAVGLATWVAGALYDSFAIPTATATASISVADVLFSVSYPLFAVGLVLLARARMRESTRLVAIDALVAALAIASLSLAVLGPRAAELAQGGAGPYGPPVAYPIVAFVLFAFTCATAITGRRWGRAWIYLSLAFGGMCVADTSYLLDAVNGPTSLGGLYDFLWLLSATALAAAAWQAEPAPVRAPVKRGSLLAFPSAFALAAVGVLLYGHFQPVGLAAAIATSLTIVAVIYRAALTLRDLDAAADRRVQSAERSAESRRLEALGELAGGIAHDFNNLLAVIINYAHFLTNSLRPGDPRREDASEISRNAERAAELTRQLTQFARGERAKPALIDVEVLLESLANGLQTTVGDRIAVSFFVEPDLPAALLASGQLDQILLNAAANARDAMSGEGALTVAAEQLQPDEVPADVDLEPGCYVRLTVTDTGEGVSHEVAEHAFDPFFSTKGGAATGLGLATTYGIVAAAGGAVRLQAAPEGGTSLELYLLAIDAGQPTPSPEERTARGGHGERVLVLDDEAALRRSTARILREHGYAVVEAANAEGAVALAEQGEAIDLLLADVVLPQGSGVEVAERLRDGQPDLPVLFMSGHPGQHLEGHGLEPGRHALVTKPIGVVELLSHVGRLLDPAREAAAVGGPETPRG